MAILRTRWRRVVQVAIAVCACAAVVTPARAQHDVEYQVKAEYLYNFVQFIEWPAATWTAADTPFRICVAGADPFGPQLDRAIHDERVDGHPLVVDHPDTDAALSRCQVVFFGRMEPARTAAVFKALASSSVLTVGESPEFLRAGGAIAFAVDGGRVRFDVNLVAPQIKDLRLSSKLLRVARSTWRFQDRS